MRHPSCARACCASEPQRIVNGFPLDILALGFCCRHRGAIIASRATQSRSERPERSGGEKMSRSYGGNKSRNILRSAVQWPMFGKANKKVITTTTSLSIISGYCSHRASLGNLIAARDWVQWSDWLHQVRRYGRYHPAYEYCFGRESRTVDAMHQHRQVS